MTILDQIDKYPKELISKGYSEEMKYKVKADKNYFLKISPLSFFKKKELELKYISVLEKVVKIPKLIEVRYESNSIYSLYEWIDGVDFRECVTYLTDKELYQYGIQAGHFYRGFIQFLLKKNQLIGMSFIYRNQWERLILLEWQI